MTAHQVEQCPPPSTTDSSPCQASWRRLTEVFGDLRIHPAAPRTDPGWTLAAALATDPAALDATIAFDERLGLELYGAPSRPDVTAGFSLHRYAWPVALAFTLPWFLERRVPALPVDRISINRTTGELTARPTAFHCLPDDPAAGRPDALVVPDRPALDAALRTALADHLAPVLDAFRPRVRRGPRTLWALVTDDVVDGLWYLSTLLDEEPRAVAELTALLPGDASSAPFVGTPGFRREGGHRTRTRVSCCLFYTVRPAEPCFSCPRSK
ncbi:(2Fe-2S)-binding protein [Kitasatospora sp. CB01950]|uniref:(2Fe-2S)-binding protein n=1 Tax=Kitasatospora sp. CB01950 TaxID=1703930 RepID=UPI00093C62BF|nr:(2Fe-2S)-binding protein [Kitasatospora sp. CB01950]OKJ08214.1 iron-sulfur protein [Kitasatospora sp. CB01950]